MGTNIEGRRSNKHNLKIVGHSNLKVTQTVKSLNDHRWAECCLPTEVGEFKMRSYPTGEIVMHVGADSNGRFDHTDEAVKVRIHSECVTSEIFGSQRCDCALQLRGALKAMNDYGKGVLVYLKQEGRGIGLHSKIKAYSLQENGLDTVDANLALGKEVDSREYSAAGRIFKDFGLKNVELLSNNPDKIKYVEGSVDKVTVARLHPDKETLSKFPWMSKYLETKKERCGHKIEIQE